jgi:hypothetical protein
MIFTISLRFQSSGRAPHLVGGTPAGPLYSLKVVRTVHAIIAAALHAALLETASPNRMGTGRFGQVSQAAP